MGEHGHVGGPGAATSRVRDPAEPRPLGARHALADELHPASWRSVRGYVDLDKSLKLGLPEVRVVPDRDKAAALGVDAAPSLATVMQAMIGGMDVATFKEAGHALRHPHAARPGRPRREEPRPSSGSTSRTADGERGGAAQPGARSRKGARPPSSPAREPPAQRHHLRRTSKAGPGRRHRRGRRAIADEILPEGRGRRPIRARRKQMAESRPAQFGLMLVDWPSS